MKKSIFTLIAVLCLVLTANAQRDGSFDRLQIKKVSEGTEVDSLLAINSKGHVKYIPQSKLAIPVPDLSNYVDLNSNQTITGTKTFNSNISANNVTSSSGALTGAAIIARSTYPRFQINDTDVNGGNVSLRLAETPSFFDVNVELPIASGRLLLENGDGSQLANVNATTFGNKTVSDFLDNSSNQYNILGLKEFTNRITFNGGSLASRLDLKPSTAISINSSYAGMQTDSNGYLMFNTPNSNTTNFAFNNSNLTAKRTYILPDAPGTLLLDTALNAEFANKFPNNGSFIPTMVDSGGGATFTYSQQTGKYKIIDNVLFFQLTMAVTQTGSVSGIVHIEGLPSDGSVINLDNLNIQRITNSALTVSQLNQIRLEVSTLGHILFKDVKGSLVDHLQLSGTSVIEITGYYSIQ
ncbi:hypothetical protein ABMY20_12585 [Tenacibaculum sp. SSH1-16]|uniref:hypothetical protein n=1 Tax=Tenacibaculum sp. SSH1-16 TaxID=3136667 RepID=UPI0032C44C56